MSLVLFVLVLVLLAAMMVDHLTRLMRYDAEVARVVTQAAGLWARYVEATPLRLVSAVTRRDWLLVPAVAVVSRITRSDGYLAPVIGLVDRMTRVRR